MGMKLDRTLDSYWVEDINAALSKEMVGHTFHSVKADADELIFESDEKTVRFFHSQDCCESVYIEDIVGDLLDLEDEPLLLVEEVTNREDPAPIPSWIEDPGDDYQYHPDSYQWTYYKFATNKGSVTVRFYGESNGYYSESVTVGITDKERKE